MINNPPSLDPADLGTLKGLFRSAFRKFIQNTDGMLPAEVVSFDRANNMVSVIPLITVLTTDGRQQPRARIAEIPVFQIGGGGFILNFNLKPGDLGWIIANDRDMSLFQNTFKQAKPNTIRIKDFADSVFYPHTMKGYDIDDEDSENVVLQSNDGTVKISLGTEKIKIKAPIVEVDAGAVTVDAESVTIASVGTVVVAGPLFRVLGNINASGSITPNVP